MFKVIIKETGKGLGQMTVVQSQETEKYYVVSSVSGAYANETYIFECDKKGSITNWTEVYGVRPNQHNKVLSDLYMGELTEQDFYNDNDYDEEEVD